MGYVGDKLEEREEKGGGERGEGKGRREGGRIEALSVTQVSFSTPHHGDHSTHKSKVCQVLWVHG